MVTGIPALCLHFFVDYEQGKIDVGRATDTGDKEEKKAKYVKYNNGCIKTTAS